MVTIPRHGLEHNSLSAIHVSIKSGLKHEIVGAPEIRNEGPGKFKYAAIFDGTNHKIYRFGEAGKVQLISINVKMGTPNTVAGWARLSMASAIVVPAVLVAFAMITGSLIPFTFELTAGMIALLVGQRVLVFRDIPLMRRWGRANRLLIGWCIAALLALMIIGSNILTSSGK